MQQLTIAAYRTHAEGRVQITLSQTDENGCGTGYRLAGPRHYNSGTTELASAVLTAADDRELRRMLDASSRPARPSCAEIGRASGRERVEDLGGGGVGIIRVTSI